MIRRSRIAVIATGAVAAGLACGEPPPTAEPFDLAIIGARVLDPESGLDAIRNVGIRGGIIEAVAASPIAGASTIEATGLVLAPGFIDLNTYEHGDAFFRLRAADGVTSVFNLEDGATDVDAYYAALEGRALLHFGTAADHESLRHLAAGDSTLDIEAGVNSARGLPELDQRALSTDEMERLTALVRGALEAGAVALGFGLYYTPGAFRARRSEGGIVVIHPRDEATQERAVEECVAHPQTMIASDGAWDGGMTHPRSAGTNSRVLGRYVRERGVLSLMAAVEKMTLLPAQHLQEAVPMMRKKGRLQVGMAADLVLFDPEKVIDQATYAEPLVPPIGIERVIVSGVVIVEAGEVVDDRFPGKAIRRRP